MMQLRLKPFDTLFFRDGKPFTMGEEGWASGIFPPPLSTIYGALRTRYFTEHPDEFRSLRQNTALDTKGDPTTRLKILRFGILLEEELLYPAPLDYVWPKNPKNAEQAILNTVIELPDAIAASGGTSQVLFNQEEVKDLSGAYISQMSMERYLLGDEGSRTTYCYFTEKGDENVSNERKFLHLEPKIGIKMDRKTRTSGQGESEGRLYRVGMQRLDDKVSLYVAFDGLEIPAKGTLKLGGEGKAVHYDSHEIHDIDSDFLIEKIAETNQFKLVLTTPAIFDEHGWLPSWVKPETGKGAYKGLELQLLASATGKPVYLGGWDMKRRRPKPMYRAVPQGSVYYFQLLNGDPSQVMEAFHAKCISEINAHQGFGYSLIGAVI